MAARVRSACATARLTMLLTLAWVIPAGRTVLLTNGRRIPSRMTAPGNGTRGPNREPPATLAASAANSAASNGHPRDSDAAGDLAVLEDQSSWWIFNGPSRLRSRDLSWYR